MNIKIRPICGVAVLLSVIFLIFISPAKSASQPSDSKSVEILAFEYPPFIKGDGTGIGERIVTAALQPQGYTVKFLYYPHKRAVINFRDGEGQLYIGIRNSFSEQKIDCEKISYFRRVFVYLKKQYPDFQMKTLDVLKGKRIGVTLGSSQANELKDAGLTLDESTIPENNMKKLYAGRTDFFYTPDLTALSMIDKLFPGQFSEFGIVEYKRDSADLIVRKNSPGENILQSYRTGLKMIIESGTYHRILEDFYGAGRVPDSAKVTSSEIR